MSKALRLIVGLLACALILWASGFDDIKQLSEVAPAPLLLGLLVSWSLSLLIAYRWAFITRAITSSEVAPFSEFLKIFILSRVAGTFVPRDVGELGTRGVWLSRLQGLSRKQVAASLLLDKLSDLALSGIFLLAVSPYWFLGFSAEFSLLLMLFVPVLGLGLSYTQPKWLLRSFSRSLLGKYGERISALPARAVPWVLFLCLSKFCLVVLRSFCASALFGLDINGELILLATPLGQLAFLVAISPGGLGVLEAGWYGILLWAGIEAHTAVLFLVGQRIIMTLSLALLAALGYTFCGGSRGVIYERAEYASSGKH